MSEAEFRAARVRSGIIVPDIWERLLSISPDQNKAYSTGRTRVPAEVAARVNARVSEIEQGATSLQEGLQSALPANAVELDERTLKITVTFPSGKRVTLVNKGVDALNSWAVYAAAPKEIALFLRAPSHPWSSTPGRQQFSWKLWRGAFVESRVHGRFQNYPNMLDGALLAEVFA